MNKSVICLFAFAISTAAFADETTGSWNFRVKPDPMTDATRGIAHTSDENDLTIVLKCDSNGPGSLYLSLVSSEYLGEGQYRTRDIKFRFDGSPPETIRATYSDRSASIFDLTPSTLGGEFLARLASANETVLQVTAYDFTTYTSVIDTRGANEAINRVAAACRDTEWSN